MDKKDILKKVDHTLLGQTATWDDIRGILDDAMKYEAASACIPAAYVKQAAEYVAGKLPICTVIGFPNGYNTTAVKVFETKDAIANGASEIDMVINIGFLKDGRYEEVENEIRAIHEACDGRILKVIIETCLLTEEEKIKMCEIVTNAGLILAVLIQWEKCDIFFVFYRENSKDGTFYLSIIIHSQGDGMMCLIYLAFTVSCAGSAVAWCTSAFVKFITHKRNPPFCYCL